MNELMPFNFDSTPVRIEDRDGEPWFVLADVCRVLGLTNPSMAAKGLDDDEQDALSITDPIGRPQPTIAINESGLYRLIFRSRKEVAQRFVKWITREVLPTIRRTGAYGAPPVSLPRDPRELLAYIQQQAGDMVALQDANAALVPKADAYDRIADAHGALSLTEAAKALKIARTSLIAWLNQSGWIYRRPATGTWLGYRDRETAGLVEHRVTRIRRPDGPDRIADQVLITAKGMAKLATLIPKS
ncbi:BRO family, N-terminal domain [Sphingomonas laterariae]|uniref:BRO family, N-terminal domain n=1 Tax=Edaphosphingomonas laterariae TaxID=861865 RepID=A0A239JJN2_9SPHN|nr:phage antirepressor [Sphingomonas laterariae]SNT06035.1 BRO family, N-terminal domain [Sphingomonas laterariae]